MTEHEEIRDKVIELTAEHLGVEHERVSETSSFIDDLGADSLDIVELVLAFEDEFGIEIPDEDLGKFNLVSDVIDYVASAKGA